MAQQDAIHRLGGAVQLDDAHLGGERAGGKPGRGSENKVTFVAAVSIDDRGHPKLLNLSLVSAFFNQAIAKWAKASLMPGSLVISDGLGRFAAVTRAGCAHASKVVGSLKQRELTDFKWVDAMLGNLKTTLSGAFHYLAAFAYWFKRRFDLRGLLASLIVDVVRTKPATHRAGRQDSC